MNKIAHKSAWADEFIKSYSSINTENKNNCWVMAVDVYKKYHNINLQHFTASQNPNRRESCRGDEKIITIEQVLVPLEWDFIFFDKFPNISHIGIILNPNTYMLHIHNNIPTVSLVSTVTDYNQNFKSASEHKLNINYYRVFNKGRRINSNV